MSSRKIEEKFKKEIDFLRTQASVLNPGQVRAQKMIKKFVQDAVTKDNTFRIPIYRLFWNTRIALGVLTIIGIITIGFVGVDTAAASMPNDTLYPLKRAVERIELALATSPQKKAQTYAAHAQHRLAEGNIDEAYETIQSGMQMFVDNDHVFSLMNFNASVSTTDMLTKDMLVKLHIGNVLMWAGDQTNHRNKSFVSADSWLSVFDTFAERMSVQFAFSQKTKLDRYMSIIEEKAHEIFSLPDDVADETFLTALDVYQKNLDSLIVELENFDTHDMDYAQKHALVAVRLAKHLEYLEVTNKHVSQNIQEKFAQVREKIIASRAQTIHALASEHALLAMGIVLAQAEHDVMHIELAQQDIANVLDSYSYELRLAQKIFMIASETEQSMEGVQYIVDTATQKQVDRLVVVQTQLSTSTQITIEKALNQINNKSVPAAVKSNKLGDKDLPNADKNRHDSFVSTTPKGNNGLHGEKPETSNRPDGIDTKNQKNQ